MTTMLQAARKYASIGWHVLPLRAKAKVPATAHGLKDATDDGATLERWWLEDETYNVGVRTGAISGVVVLDIDGPDGEVSWSELTSGDEPKTLHQRTGREDGGRQLFFEHPGGEVKIGNRAAIRPGIDVRGDGGYVVVPPSIHPSGATYKWLVGGKPQPLPTWLLEILVKPVPVVKPNPPARRTVFGETSAYGRKALEAECANVRATPEGGRNHALNVASFAVGTLVGGGEVDRAEAEAELVSAGLDCGLPEREVRVTVEHALSDGSSSPRNAPERDDHGTYSAPPPGDADAPQEEQESWRAELQRSPDSNRGPGAVKSTLGNALIYVSCHPLMCGRLSFDVRYLRAEWKTPPPWDRQGSQPRPVDEGDAVKLARWLASNEYVSFSEGPLWSALVTGAKDNPVDRVREYLDALVWDETNRLDNWLHDFLGTPDSAYSRAAGAAWAISAVARAMKPGCQADHILVLEGKQGVGKSQTLAALGGNFYSEVPLDPGDKDSTLAIHGPWIVEWSELSGLSRREAETVKSFLSKREDRIRPPYGKHTLDLPRRCVLAATTNEAAYMRDASGNRRYWPVEVTETDPAKMMTHRDQLWAEARYRYLLGERWWLTGTTLEDAQVAQSKRQEVSPWLDTIASALDVGGRFYGDDFISTTQLMELLDLKPRDQNTGTARTLAQVMDRIGFGPDRKSLNGSKRRGYSKRPDQIELRETSGPGHLGYDMVRDKSNVTH